jgi:enoyl-CoA hydratase/carnithine racemase
MVRKYNFVRWSFNSQSGIGRVVIDRPEAMNALSPELREELANGLERFVNIEREPHGPRVTSVIIEGAGGRAVSVGADVNADEELNPGKKELRREIAALPKIPMPVIAKIDGYCLGGGLELALACDFRIATINSEFGLPESRLGILPANGGIQRLASHVGPSRAKELVMSGERISAERAASDGFVDYVCDRDEIDSFIKEFIHRISAGAPLAVRATKEIVNTGLGTDLETAIAYEHHASRALRTTQDYIEGQQAFEENRDPKWHGK